MEKILTSAVGVSESWHINSYKERGGYTAISKAKTMKPDELISEVKKANLRGRGGAGFPCGVKWGFLPKNVNVPKYLVINADEGEPGTFKDRLLMNLDPHRLIEGCIISGMAMGMRACYIYVRGELFLSMKRLWKAIEEAYAAGYLGRDACGIDGWQYDIYVQPGAGAYICGEETALIESLEGKAGQPRLKPPFPAAVGVFSCPTIVNNVETIACVPTIIERGGDWWAEQGCERNGGPKMVGLSGHVNNPGIYEVPHGFSLRDLIYDPAYGGGIRGGKKLKGVIPGGASCPVILPNQIDIGMDFDSPQAEDIGTMLGTACATVMDEDTCMVRVAANLAHFYHHESCGQCTPCREGTGWVTRLLDDVEAGTAQREDVDLLMDICDNIEGNTICPFGDAVAMAIRSYVVRFRDEFLMHVEKRGCWFPSWGL